MRFTKLAGATGPADSMNIILNVCWHIKVDDDVDILNVKTTRSHISSQQDIALQHLVLDTLAIDDLSPR